MRTTKRKECGGWRAYITNRERGSTRCAIGFIFPARGPVRGTLPAPCRRGLRSRSHSHSREQCGRRGIPAPRCASIRRRPSRKNRRARHSLRRDIFAGREHRLENILLKRFRTHGGTAESNGIQFRQSGGVYRVSGKQSNLRSGGAKPFGDGYSHRFGAAGSAPVNYSSLFHNVCHPLRHITLRRQVRRCGSLPYIVHSKCPCIFCISQKALWPFVRRCKPSTCRSTCNLRHGFQ